MMVLKKKPPCVYVYISGSGIGALDERQNQQIIN